MRDNNVYQERLLSSIVMGAVAFPFTMIIYIASLGVQEKLKQRSNFYTAPIASDHTCPSEIINVETLMLIGLLSATYIGTVFYHLMPNSFFTKDLTTETATDTKDQGLTLTAHETPIQSQ